MTASEDGPPRPHADSRVDPSAPPIRAFARGVDQSAVYSVELMAGILTWMGLGWLADQWLGTMPWLMVAGALVGNAAGLYLIWVRTRDLAEDGATGGTATGRREAGAPSSTAQEGGEPRASTPTAVTGRPGDHA